MQDIYWKNWNRVFCFFCTGKHVKVTTEKHYNMATKQFKKVIKDDDLVTMFNQMINGEGDPDIVAQKMEKMKKSIKTLYNLIIQFAGPDRPFTRNFTEYKDWVDDMYKWGVQCEPLLECKTYQELKADNQIRQIILLCQSITPHAHHLKDITGRWILNMPGLSYVPFSFTKLDLKRIWENPQCNDAVKRYVVQTLDLLHKTTTEIYQLYSSPDVNITRFSEAIVSSIEKIQGLPELSRCKAAFKKIIESASLLQENFGNYYRDMVQSKNPNTIIESFISDVSNKSSSMTPKLLNQFQSIIRFYKKQSDGKPKDPKVQKLMDALSDKMKGVEIGDSKSE
jgi:hypothetical protein